MFKIVIIGPPKSGKSTIFKNVNGHFIFKQTPRAMLGTDFLELEYFRYNLQPKIGLWDVSSHPRFETMHGQFVRGSKAVIVVFDMTNKQSYNEA